MRVRVQPEALWLILARYNMSQNELARELGVSSGYMSQLVCGSRSPSPRLRRRILEHLKPMTFDDLFVIESDGDNGRRA